MLPKGLRILSPYCEETEKNKTKCGLIIMPINNTITGVTKFGFGKRKIKTVKSFPLKPIKAKVKTIKR